MVLIAEQEQMKPNIFAITLLYLVAATGKCHPLLPITVQILHDLMIHCIFFYSNYKLVIHTCQVHMSSTQYSIFFAFGLTAAADNPCQLPKESGHSCGIHRYYFDSELQECVRFWYKGRGGNKNNFKTLEDCVNQCSREYAYYVNVAMVDMESQNVHIPVEAR